MLTTIKIPIYAVKIYKNKPKIYFKLVCAPGVPVLDPPLSLNIIILYFTHVCIVRLYNIHCGKYIGVHKFPLTHDCLAFAFFLIKYGTTISNHDLLAELGFNFIG